MAHNNPSRKELNGLTIFLSENRELIETLTLQKIYVQGQLTSHATKQAQVKCPASWQTEMKSMKRTFNLEKEISAAQLGLYCMWGAHDYKMNALI